MQHFALFIPTLEIGGAERVTVTLANGIAGRGYQVTLLTVRDDGQFRANVDKGVNIVALGGSGVFAALPALVRWLKHNRPDAMLSMMSHTNLISIAARALSKTHTRLVISERVSLSHAIPDIKGKLVRFLTRLFYNKADHITVVTKAMIAEFVKHAGVPESKISAIYNPVIDSQFLCQSNETSADLHPWFYDADRTVILAVGRLDIQKGFETLIRAFAMVAEHDKNAHLVVLGDGAQRARLETLRHALGLDERVALPGFAVNPFPSMKKADLFVLSSLSEGLPGVLVQAMACGVRVVSTDCPTGPREILEDGKWGTLVPVRDEAALAQAIITTLKMSDPPNVRSRAAFFDEATSVNSYLEILRDNSEIIDKEK